MFDRHRWLAVFIAAGAVGGCTSDKVVGRYNTAFCQSETSQPGGASSFTVPVPCASIFPRAAAFAGSIPSEIQKSVGSNDGSDHGGRATSSLPTKTDDRSVFHRTLIVTVRKEGGFNPEDRLEATDVLIRPMNARFDSWDNLATAYTTISAGSVSLTQARGTTQSGSLGAPSGTPVSGGVTLGASQTDTRAETLIAGSQVETVTATVEEDGRVLRIHRQGGYGVDLTGSTIIRADLAFAPPTGSANRVTAFVFSVAAYTDNKGKPLPPSKIILAARPVIGLPPGTTLRATVDLIYTIRHVIRGGSTYEEKDDDVLERTVGPVSNVVTLVPVREASPAGYGVHLTQGDYRDYAVNAAVDGRDPVGVCFDDANDAEDFLAYLKAHDLRRPDRLGKARLGIVGPPTTGNDMPFAGLTSPDIATAQVRAGCS